jgi:hypothetical protein
MASFINKVTCRTGTVGPVWFNVSGVPGDWQTFHIPFQPFMPAAADGQVRIMVTASGEGLAANDHMAAAVPLVGEVSYMGFTAWLRNSDVSTGSAGLSWVAIAEVPDSVGGQPVPATRLRSGILQPQHFQTDGYRGDWRRWAVSCGSRIGFTSLPVAVLSATNQNVRVHAAACVGVVVGTSMAGFNVASRNSDVGSGACNFNFLAVEPASGGI